MDIKTWASHKLKSWLGLDGGLVWPGGGNVQYRPSTRVSLDSNTIIQACLTSILEAFVDAPMVTTTTTPDGQDEYRYDTQLAALMTRPNPLRKIGGRRLWKATVASYELDGNAYWDLTKDRAGFVRELMYVPHWSITPKEERGTGLLSHYEVLMADGSQETREVDQIVHFANGLDPNNPLKGRSPLKSALLQVMTDNEADLYSSEIMTNPAVMGLAVLPKGETVPSIEQADHIASKLNTKFGRGGRGGLFVNSFAADLQNVGFSPEQLALDTLRRTPEERISAIMNVPAIVAGLGAGLDRSTYSNMKDARRSFAQYKMAGLWDFFEEEVSTQLAPMTEGWQEGDRAGFDRRRIADLQDDQNELHDRVRADFVANLIKRGEGRAALGMEAAPEDDVYFSDVQVGMDTERKAIMADIAEKAKARRTIYEATFDSEP